MVKAGMRKRTASLVLVLALCCGWFAALAMALPMGARAATGSGTQADPILWDITSDGTLTAENGKYYVVSGDYIGGANRVYVPTGVSCTITLSSVSINGSATDDFCAFQLEGTAAVALWLEGTNTLQSGDYCAGLQVPAGASLSIYGSGSLSATGGNNSAGIGGASNFASGTIAIYGGAITANGNGGGAGIGGGKNGAGGTITIYGGTITANGDGSSTAGGSGIGSGSFGAGGTIAIHGGVVNATGGFSGAGIGGGIGAAGGTITITGGTVTATGKSGGAGIGGGGGRNGPGGDGGVITLLGGAISAYGGAASATTSGGGAGIGGGGGESDQFGGTAGTLTKTSALTPTATGGDGGMGHGMYGKGGAGAAVGSGGGGGISAPPNTDGAPGVDATWTPATPSSDAVLNNFWVNGYSATISGTEVTLLLPPGINLAALAPSFHVSSGADVEVVPTQQTSGVTQLDFSGSWHDEAIVYTVTSADGKSNTYKVRVGTLYPYVTAFPSYTGQAGGITGTINAAYSKFDNGGTLHTGAGVWVGNTQLADGTHYIHANSSTAITLLPAYLDTLANGTYNIEVRFADGLAEAATFTVAKAVPTPASAADPGPGSPQTGDNTNTPLWAAFGTLALAGLTLCGIAARKRFGRKAE